MTPKEKAIQLVDNFRLDVLDFKEGKPNLFTAKECALTTVDEIILANPHSNPFNTDVHSTESYWMEVKQKIKLL